MHAGPFRDRFAVAAARRTLSALVRKAMAGLHADYAWLELEHDGNPLTLTAPAGAEPEPDVSGIAQRARASGGRLTIDDVHGSAAAGDASAAHETRAVLALPLRLEGRVVGTIGVACAQPRSWSTQDNLLLGALASAAEAIVEVENLQQEIADQARVSRGLNAQNVAIQSLADASSVEDALARVLVDVAPLLGFDAGACWLSDHAPAPVLRCRAFWSRVGSAIADFEHASRNAAFARGAGLPGVVWAGGRSVWQDYLDTVDAGTEPRVEAALRAGLRAALAFPVVAGRDVVGVIEFHAAAPLLRDQELLDGLESLGAHVGAFLHRKRTEAALVESEARYRILSETASDPIFTIDETSTILYVNPAVERVFGYTPQELIGRSMTMLIPLSLRARHRAGLRRHAETGERHIPWSGVQLPGLHRDGHELPLEISFGEYRHDGIHVYTGIARDISDRVAQQEALRQQAQQLARLASELEITIEEVERQRDEALHAREEADRSNRAKSDFLAIMSHELRTPLNAIMGYTDLLESGIPESIPPGPRQKVSRIAFSARHLLALIEEVLMYSRLEAGGEMRRVESFSLRTLLDDVSGVVEPLAQARSLRYECDAPADPGTFDSDVQKIRQILINLLGNAVKFTDNGSVRLRLERDDGDALFHIEDTGIGIAAEDLDTVFASFWQAQRATTRSVGGTGLGLSVSRRLARLLGGEVSVRSTLGEGSTFTVRLPPLTGRTGVPL